MHPLDREESRSVGAERRNVEGLKGGEMSGGRDEGTGEPTFAGVVWIGFGSFPVYLFIWALPTKECVYIYIC